MAIRKKWSEYTMETVRRNTSDNFGVYEIGNGSEVLYIGEGHVRTRLLRHFPNATEPVVGSSTFRFEYTGSKRRAVQRQNALLKEFQRKHKRLPNFNQRSRN